MSDSSSGLQELLDAYNAASKRFGLRINAGKTEVLCMGPETVFFVDETPLNNVCLLYTSPSPRDGLLSRMPSSA